MSNPKMTHGLEIRKTGDDVLVHDPTNLKVHVLNGTAGYVLELCDGERSAIDIAQLLCDATGADIAIVARDVEGIVRDFQALHLVDAP